MMTNMNTTTTTTKTAIPTKTKTTTPTIYDVIKYVKSDEFHASLAEHALQFADQKVYFNVRAFRYDPDNRIWIITLWRQKVIGPNELIKTIKRQIDNQIDSKNETIRLQQMVDLDHLLVKKGRVHGRPVLIVQLVED